MPNKNISKNLQEKIETSLKDLKFETNDELEAYNIKVNGKYESNKEIRRDVFDDCNIKSNRKYERNKDSRIYTYKYVYDIEDVLDFRNKKLLFVAEIDDIGIDIDMLLFLKKLTSKGKDSLENSTAGIVVFSKSDDFTKRFAQDIIFCANSLGCCFIGHPLVESIEGFKNFSTWKKTMDLSFEDICVYMLKNLIQRILEYTYKQKEETNILVLYSSPHKYSNTRHLWSMVASNIKKNNKNNKDKKNNKNNINIKELLIEENKIQDCKGCPYEMCIHYGKKNTCFYGGVITEDVLPSIKESDVIVWLCPNYNDSISANLMATINRLTVLYRKMNFYEKSIIGVIVSGNSGSDSIAKQLIGSLNVNKGFRLPPYFSIRAIANDPKAIEKIDGIEDRARTFCENMMKNI
jgi:multimeric flavodoxin WrbA